MTIKQRPRKISDRDRKVLERVAHLMLAGRRGRAARLWAAHFKIGSPRMWSNEADRVKWANDILAGNYAGGKGQKIGEDAQAALGLPSNINPELTKPAPEPVEE